MNILDKKPQLIPKHQKGSGEKGIQIQYNGPQYYEIVEQMKKEDPDTYNRLQIEIARKQNPNSEIVMYTDADGNQKRATNIGAGFVSGTDPIGAAYVEAVIGDKILGSIGNYAKARLISKAINSATPIKKELPLNVGWGPKQTIKVTHATNSEKPLQLFFDKRYDVTHEGANPFGIWYQGKLGQPRTAATNSLPGKAEKAEKARKVFADRKYKHEGDLTLDKPITTVGEVPDRSVLSREAEKMGADGIVYNNVYDNGFDNNQVILSFKTPEKTSINVVKENAHKLSDKEWDQIYETALKEGDTKKLKELRALHFQVKSGNDPQVFAHSTNNTFNQFDKSFFGQTDEGFNGSGFYFTTTRVPENQSIFKIAKGPNGEIPYMNYGRNKKYFYLKGDREYNVGDPSRNFFEEANTVGFVSPKDSKVSEVVVGQPTQVKNTRAITYDDNGNFIPLSKRDDFTNPDFRYKKGAKILIKKKNRGKFTEYCGGKVTDECIQKAKKSKNPTLRKRATFAQNARQWNK